MNGTLADEKTVLLDSQTEIVSFGFVEVEIPPDPPSFIPELNDWLLVALFALVGIAIAIVLGIYVYKVKQKQQNKTRPLPRRIGDSPLR